MNRIQLAVRVLQLLLKISHRRQKVVALLNELRMALRGRPAHELAHLPQRRDPHVDVIVEAGHLRAGVDESFALARAELGEDGAVMRPNLGALYEPHEALLGRSYDRAPIGALP